MEYIVINDSKLKIICEEKDLEPYGVSAHALEYGDAVSRKFLEHLLDEARERLGFETVLHRVLIQLFPDNRGGCEIFVNKLGLLKGSAEKTSDDNSEALPPVASKKEITKKLFFFEKLDFMLEACKRLSFLPSAKKSSAFYLEEKGYYLYLELNADAALEEYGISVLDEYSFLLEYGEPQGESKLLPYLAEYAKCVCKENAVETLGRI